MESHCTLRHTHCHVLHADALAGCTTKPHLCTAHNLLSHLAGAQPANTTNTTQLKVNACSGKRRLMLVGKLCSAHSQLLLNVATPQRHMQFTPHTGSSCHRQALEQKCCPRVNAIERGSHKDERVSSKTEHNRTTVDTSPIQARLHLTIAGVTDTQWSTSSHLHCLCQCGTAVDASWRSGGTKVQAM